MFTGVFGLASQLLRYWHRLLPGVHRGGLSAMPKKTTTVDAAPGPDRNAPQNGARPVAHTTTAQALPAGAEAEAAGPAVQAGHSAPPQTSDDLTSIGVDAMEEAQIHAELLQLQRRIFALDMGLPEMLQKVAEAALRVSGAGSEGGAMVELVQDGQLVVQASSGPLGSPLGSAVALDDSTLWPTLREGRKLLCNDTRSAGWGQASGHGCDGMHAALAVPLCGQTAVVGLLKVVANRAHVFTARSVAHLEILAESVGSMVQLRHLTDQLKAAQRQYKTLFDVHPQPMWVHAVEGTPRLLAVNQAAVSMYGYSEAELLQTDLHQLVAAQADSAAPWPLPCTALLQQHSHRDGQLLDVEVSTRPTSFNGVRACQVMVTDVTEQLRTRRELARVSRAQHLLSLCNETLVRATSETALLGDICQIAVDIGGYRIAWVGMARDDERKSIEPVAHASLDMDHADALNYLGTLNLSWSLANAGGRGPAGAAVRSGSAVISHNVANDVTLRHDLEKLQQRGVRALISLPLRHAEHTFGVLCLYSGEVLDVNVQETRLLQDLANDLAFGITGLRNRHEQQRLQASVLKVAAAVSASTGTAFFEQLARNMAEALGAQLGCVARLVAPVHPGEEMAAVSLAVVSDGVLLANLKSNLTGTPSQRLLTQRQYLLAQNVQKFFPNAPLVQTLGAQAYAGMQLSDSQGAPLGVLFVLFRQPVTNPEFVLSTLQIFASRSAVELERQLADAHIRRQASLLDSAQDAIMVLDLQHHLLFWNKGAERIYGWPQEEVLGQSVSELICNDLADCKQASTTVLAEGSWKGEMEHKRRGGSTLDTEGRWTLVCNDDGMPESILCIHTDITQRKATERQIQHLAFYDALTGLPNRMLLMDRMHQALASARRHGQGGALLFIDLDNFKTLNDTLGHHKGDLLLQQVAQRLGTCVRSVDTVARLGGDEFVVLLEGLSAEQEMLARNARDVGEKILACLSKPYDLVGYQYRSTPSIGIAPFTSLPDSSDDNTTVGELLKQADLAMYQSKTAGRHTLRFFDPHMQKVVSERAALEADLRTALAENQFSLHYQPQVDHQGRYTGVEALLRWAHPERGSVPPAQFIALAEETGLILMLGRWVLHTACQRLARWRKHPQLRHLTMAVNVSPRQFRHASFVQDVVRVLAVTGAPSSLLKLELTESQLVEDMDTTIATMTALRTYCVGFSLDDFGTGYSSLSYLKRMPLDQLKIDQSFVRDLLTDPNDAAIVKTIIGLSEGLGLSVIAEGVETVEQRDVLLAGGCRHFQGHLFGRPVADDAIDTVLLAPPPAVAGLDAHIANSQNQPTMTQHTLLG